MSPVNDCRITIRCLRECFDFTLDRDRPFSALRSENSFIDAFFERRGKDNRGGEGGERILSIKTRPCYSLHNGRTRGATWFERKIRVVWLLRAEIHDDRHKGGSDAYDVFKDHDSVGTLFPERADYLLLEYHSRLLDAASFAPDVARDALQAFSAAQKSPGVILRAEIAGIPARVMFDANGSEVATLTLGVSTAPVKGPRSGFDFPLDQSRFLLLAEAARSTLEGATGSDVLVEEIYDVSVLLRGTGAVSERFLLFVFQRSHG